MSHMSCKTPHRAAQRWPPGEATEDTHRPYQAEAHEQRGAPSESRETPRSCPPLPPPSHAPAAAHLGALLQAAAQLLQALPGGAAGRALGEGSLHVGGAITQPALDAVALVELVHLPGTQEGGRRPRQGTGPQTACYAPPLGKDTPELMPPAQPLTAVQGACRTPGGGAAGATCVSSTPYPQLLAAPGSWAVHKENVTVTCALSLPELSAVSGGGGLVTSCLPTGLLGE